MKKFIIYNNIYNKLMSYRRKLQNLLVRNALNKTRAERYPRLESRLRRTKFRQRYRKRLPNLPFPPARLKRFEENAIARLLRRGFRRDRKAKRKYGAPVRKLYRDQMEKLERRALKRQYGLLPFSVKLERALEKEKFKKITKAARKKRRKAFRKLSLQELRRSGLTETEVQREIDRRLLKLAAPEFPEVAAAPEFFPVVRAEEPELPEIGEPPSPPPGGIPFVPFPEEEEEEEEIFGPMVGEEEGEDDEEGPPASPRPRPLFEEMRRRIVPAPPLRVEEEMDPMEELEEGIRLLEQELARQEELELGQAQEQMIGALGELEREEEERARQRTIQTSPEQVEEMFRQRTAEEIAAIERREAFEQIGQEHRDVPGTRGVPAVPVAREGLPESGAMEQTLEQFPVAEMPGAPEEEARLIAERTIRGIEFGPEEQRQMARELREAREATQRQRELTEEQLRISEAQLERSRIQQERSRQLLESTSVERLEESQRRLEEEVAELLRLEEEGEGSGKRGKGLISGKYSKAEREAFRKQLEIQVDLFRMERERRARLHARPIESIAAEALERSGRKPNKYIEAIKRVKKAYPYISGKDAMKGGHVNGRESFGEGKSKKYKRKSSIRGEASRKASLTNPWIIHLKKVMPGLKKKYPGKPHKYIMKKVKETYTPVKKSKKKGGEILPALMVAAGKKKRSGMEKHMKKMKKKYPNLSHEQCMMIANKTYKNPKAMKKVKKMMRGGEFFGM